MSYIADFKLSKLSLDLFLSLFVVSVPAAANDNDDDGSDGCADGSPEEKCGIDSIVVVALCVLPLMVVVPLRTVSVVVAALPGAILIGAALVISHIR